MQPVPGKLPSMCGVHYKLLLQICTIFLLAKWVFQCMLIGKREKLLPLKTEHIQDCIPA